MLGSSLKAILLLQIIQKPYFNKGTLEFHRVKKLQSGYVHSAI